MATKANLAIDQGSTFSTTITLTDDNGDPVDLTGYTGRGQIRKHYSSNTAHDFTVSTGDASGEVTISLTAVQTANIEGGRYLYDVEILIGNTVSRVLQGIVTIDPECTR